MKIVDTYNDIFSLFGSGEFDIGLWRKYADSISTELTEKVEADTDKYDFERQVLPVINNLFENKSLAEKAHTSFLEVTENLSERIMENFCTDLDVTIILYLGLCNGAGWATQLNNKPVVLLGLEKIVELGWCDKKNMIALIYHELGHIWHFSISRSKHFGYSFLEKAVEQLYQEGIAMVFEQILCDDENLFHQDNNDWLNWCTLNECEIKREFLRRAENEESVQDFFGDWCSYKGYSDVGYYLGARFVRYMMKDYELKEIAGFEIKKVCSEFEKFAKAV